MKRTKNAVVDVQECLQNVISGVSITITGVGEGNYYKLHLTKVTTVSQCIEKGTWVATHPSQLW